MRKKAKLLILLFIAIVYTLGTCQSQVPDKPRVKTTELVYEANLFSPNPLLLTDYLNAGGDLTAIGLIGLFVFVALWYQDRKLNTEFVANLLAMHKEVLAQNELTMRMLRHMETTNEDRYKQLRAELEQYYAKIEERLKNQA
jgi:hypothetical protein